ncbi:xyloside xylosyltransferase 1-like [Branchiostoma floridae]|uniref:Xyloside xylosyltransferase 1-like n=1 Tax=Branchiostoma floridae TaxID=7739 RepID=A0A9J7HWZ1_BRAFL|nr:xyloside xylosyltransferase 1-like [Branchiostoma floridae]
MAKGGAGKRVQRTSSASSSSRRFHTLQMGLKMLTSLKFWAAILVVALVLGFYQLAGRETFSDVLAKEKKMSAAHMAQDASSVDPLKTKAKTDTKEPNPVKDGKEQHEASDETRDTEDSKKDSQIREYHVLQMFTKAGNNRGLIDKFKLCFNSMMQKSSIRPDNGEILHLHLVSDPDSKAIAEGIVDTWLKKGLLKLSFHDPVQLTETLYPIVKPMQEKFSAGANAYYGDSIFFLSVGMHKVFPSDTKHIVQLDCDLKFRSDIRELFDMFDHFESDNVIGIAEEQQPVYRHTFWQYRNEHKGTKVGDPPPNGQPGFNSGVLLLDLDKMRGSRLYNSLLNGTVVHTMSEEFHFKGHLGDQDYFTLLSYRYPQLFHVLPCTWNRQLCTWWQDKGYQEVFDFYHDCAGEINIYHGNCNTPIPDG